MTRGRAVVIREHSHISDLGNLVEDMGLHTVRHDLATEQVWKGHEKEQTMKKRKHITLLLDF